RLRLVLEALELLRVQRRRERQHFEGDAPAERQLLGLVNDAHAAAADLAADAEVAELAALRQQARTGRRALGGRLPQPGGRLVERFQFLDVRAEQLGMLRVPGRQLVEVG